MLLAIDIGNTNIVIGVFAGEQLAATWRLATEPSRMPDEYAVYFESLFSLAGFIRRSVDGIIIGGVVPAVQSALVTVSREYFELEPLLVSPSLDLGLEVAYQPPTAVGADRIANALATIHTLGAPAVVVDFGTATTFDAIDADRVYAGGAIAPGLEVAQEGLFRATAQLPRVPLEPPPSPVGDTTITSLQSGILYGYAGLVDGLVERFRQVLGESAVVVATGGLAPTIAPLTRSIAHVDQDLTLVGLRLLYERNTAHAHHPRVRQA